MTLRLTALLIATLAVGACTGGTDGPFSNPSEGALAGVASELPLGDGAIPGSPDDPTSPAYFQQTVGDRILFEVDQSTLNAQAREVLDLQADFLLRNMEYSAIIEGHADEQGTTEYNLALGARRAASVRDHLISRGIAGDRLRTVSFGKERPLQICSSENCYAQNRRGVTILDGLPTPVAVAEAVTPSEGA